MLEIEDLGFGGLLFARRRGRRPLPLTKDVPPCMKHVGGVVEPLSVVAPERLFEKRCHGLAERGVEEVRLERHLAVEDPGIALSVAPRGKRSRCHLVESHRGRKPLCVGVPPFALV